MFWINLAFYVYKIGHAVCICTCAIRFRISRYDATFIFWSSQLHVGRASIFFILGGKHVKTKKLRPVARRNLNSNHVSIKLEAIWFADTCVAVCSGLWEGGLHVVDRVVPPSPSKGSIALSPFAQRSRQPHAPHYR